MLVSEPGQAIGHRAGAELRSAGINNAGWLAAGVGIDHRDALHWSSVY